MKLVSCGFAVCLVACIGCGGERSTQPREHAATPAPPPAPPPPPVLDRAALIRGEVPATAEMDLVRGRCQICHTVEYVTQQRLTAAQWAKTLNKMQTWGAPITDAEKQQLGPYLAATWPTDLPERTSPRVATPEGARSIGPAIRPDSP